MKGKQRRMPDGKLTNNRREYLRAWYKVARPIEKATETKLTAFDPDFQFSTAMFGYTFRMGAYEARMMSLALTGQWPRVQKPWPWR